MNQSQFLEITCNSLKTREKWRVHGAIGFGFASHWLRNWRESFKWSLITERIDSNHVITFDRHLKTALLERSIRKNHIPLLFLVSTSNALFVLTLHSTDWVNFGLLVFRRRVTTRRLIIVLIFYSDIPHVCLKVVVQVPCRSKFYRDTNQCKGPATLTIKV